MTQYAQNSAHKSMGVSKTSGANQYSRSSYGGGYRPNNPNGPRGFDMGKPKKNRSPKKIILICLITVIVFFAGIVGVDFLVNNGRVHAGVKVEGIDVGGMTKAEAATELQAKLDSRLAGSSVTIKPDSATQERLRNRAVSETGEVIVVSDETAVEGEQSDLSWTYTAADLGVSVDATTLVEEAYAVGQITDFMNFFPGIFERLGCYFGQTDLEASAEYNEEAFSAVTKSLNDTVSIEMVNCNIALDVEGNATVQIGQIGEKVEETTLKEKISQVFFGDAAGTIDIPTVAVPFAIDEAEAQAVADTVNSAIAEPVTLTYEGGSWSVERPTLGSWVVTTTEGEGEDVRLVPSLDTTKTYDGMQAILGDVGYGSAQNATIDVSSGAPVIVGGEAGVGPDLNAATIELTTILFGHSASERVVNLVSGQVQPAVTAEDVAAMGIRELITTYKLSYGTGSGSNREYNIEHCLDTLNNSYVAPGANWNWNEVVGPCNLENGYREASVIGADNEYTQAAGGGICNVATGVFNAAYEAGLPVVERSNHSLYQANYPLGRDAAVYWEYPTLVFSNDTDNYILMTVSYDGSYMYISIWGTNQQRSVTSENSEWKTHEDGATSITNYRKVYNADGSLRYEDSFYSYFPSTD